MSIFDGLTEMSGKRCHASCKEQTEAQWRKIKGLERF